MFFYWRIIEELKFIGELWDFKDPSLMREYKLWLKRNAYSLSLAECFEFPLFSVN